MRYTVTGGTGFIGSYLVAALKKDGHWVRAVDVKHRPERSHLYNQADDVLIADLRDPNTANLALAGADRVFHLAADHGGAGYFHSDADQPAARNNMRIDLNMLDACEKQGVDRMFYAGSFCAYPTDVQDQPRPLSEDQLDSGKAERCYGTEKGFMAMLCGASRMDLRCGIFATIYGPLAEADGIRAKFPTAIVRRILDAKHGGGKVEIWGDGTQIRTFLWINDAIVRIRAVMETDAYTGPVNIASDDEVTVRECADWACQAAGYHPTYDWRSDKPTGVAARTPDNSLFESRYGRLPQTSAKSGFGQLVEWMEHQDQLKAAGLDKPAIAA